jgi:hypothetical protein
MMDCYDCGFSVLVDVVVIVVTAASMRSCCSSSFLGLAVNPVPLQADGRMYARTLGELAGGVL